AAADALDVILRVGTTQAFSDEAVPIEDIQRILLAGLAAESAINQQPWFLVAVTDKAVMAELSASGGMPGGSGKPAGGGMPAMPGNGEMPERPADGAFPGMPADGSMPAPPADGERPAMPGNGEKAQGGPPAGMGGGAKAALGDSPLAVLVYKDTATSSPNPYFDCGLAVQNMYIAASSLGYGVKVISSPTMTLNGANHDAICEKLGVDPALSAVVVLLIGKPDQSVDGVTGASVRAGLEEKTVIVG
nr:nitroreductase family protein [Oscillospiraceae bacterium]